MAINNPTYTECRNILKIYPIVDLLLVNNNATSRSLHRKYGFSLEICEVLLFFIPKKTHISFCREDNSIRGIHQILSDVRCNCDDIPYIITSLQWHHNKSNQIRARLLFRVYKHLVKVNGIKPLLELEQQLNLPKQIEEVLPCEYTILQEIESNLKTIKE